ncbi:MULTISPECIES: anti-sigma factor [unclassified Rhodococcus (in: high G+C Gram-positive bacteria)]|uniref:anti-sigma factor n=1 Tax=unclassified Rhodococcus (in: high G+C Gram-positive bacteria) TaxID=192944 RepID=UPI00163B237A|nr:MULTISPECIES: anti-sigma factor [unclassified Rhodococcus (in: high G+C Gram-positive bacteria)]MBC2640122.1 anti-sigma factor [Rhodococcus sp. 3A]MBC2895132.1 anti-sigma factor [Rhodococcus sp. 4CII]
MDESQPDILDLAQVYALDAVDDQQRLDIDAAVRQAPPHMRREFDIAVRGVHETMAAQSASTAVDPPAHLLGRILDALPETTAAPAPVSLDAARARKRKRLLTALGAAAAVVVLAVGGITVAQQLQSEEGQPVPAQILAADDVRTAVAPIAGGGSATVVFSKEVDAGVLVMNDVPPPAPGSAYQIWLLGPTHEPVSAGVMEADDVAPSTTAVVNDIDQSTALGFSVEPPGGSTQPTGDIFATVNLT